MIIRTMDASPSIQPATGVCSHFQARDPAIPEAVHGFGAGTTGPTNTWRFDAKPTRKWMNMDGLLALRTGWIWGKTSRPHYLLPDFFLCEILMDGRTHQNMGWGPNMGVPQATLGLPSRLSMTWTIWSSPRRLRNPQCENKW